MRKHKLLTADLTLILITVIWGSPFTIVKKSLARVSPLLFLGLRFWIAYGAKTVAYGGPGFGWESPGRAARNEPRGFGTRKRGICCVQGAEYYPISGTPTSLSRRIMAI